MAELRYNRTFKEGMTALLFCVLLFSSVIAFFIVSTIQYNYLVEGMDSLEATIIDIDLDIHHKGPDEQEIYIEYEVKGVTYQRELETDTAISFSAGTSARYSVGDKIQIFYDPQNPEIIAVPRSVRVGYFWLAFASFFLILTLYLLAVVLKKRQKFLVTEEEYKEEGEERKRAKQARKEQKRKAKLKRKKKRNKE